MSISAHRHCLHGSRVIPVPYDAVRWCSGKYDGSKPLIDIGERAGSGIPNIFRVWREQGWAMPVITEQLEPERTMLTLALTKSDDKKAAIKTIRQKNEIIAYLTDHVSARSADIADLLGVKSTWAKKLLSELITEEIVVAEGGNRNRTYRLKA